MVVGGHRGVRGGLLPDGVGLHHAGDGERPAQHVGARRPPIQEEQRLAPEEQTGIQGKEGVKICCGEASRSIDVVFLYP